MEPNRERIASPYRPIFDPRQVCRRAVLSCARFDSSACSRVDDENVRILTTKNNATTLVVDGLAPYTRYTISVRGENHAGNSQFGPENTFRTLGEAPRNAPTIQLVRRSFARISRLWTDRVVFTRRQFQLEILLFSAAQRFEWLRRRRVARRYSRSCRKADRRLSFDGEPSKRVFAVCFFNVEQVHLKTKKCCSPSFIYANFLQVHRVGDGAMREWYVKTQRQSMCSLAPAAEYMVRVISRRLRA